MLALPREQSTRFTSSARIGIELFPFSLAVEEILRNQHTGGTVLFVRIHADLPWQLASAKFCPPVCGAAQYIPRRLYDPATCLLHEATLVTFIDYRFLMAGFEYRCHGNND